MKGALFENLVVNEFIKRNFNRGENRQPFFWQDNHGREIDCLLADGEETIPVEIKSGKTVSTGYFENLKFWQALTDAPEQPGYVVYGGDQSMQTSAGFLVGWRDLARIPG
jgi:predicted AAA+ superfamily ATPase